MHNLQLFRILTEKERIHKDTKFREQEVEKYLNQQKAGFEQQKIYINQEIQKAVKT